MTWRKFAALISSGRYNDGVAVSLESDRDFGGPISEIEASNTAASIFVTPCATQKSKGWSLSFPEGRLISNFSYAGVAEPKIDDEGRISYFVYGCGRVKIFPKEHPEAAELLSLNRAVTVITPVPAGASVSQKIWTDEEILKMWPQAKGELEGYQRHLQHKAPITASQLGMMLQLAETQFRRMYAGQ